MDSEQDVQEMFYKIYKKEIIIEEFENWLYENDSIENCIGEKLYFQLLNINYRNKYAEHEVEKLIYHLINFGSFETRRIIMLLENILNDISLYNTMDVIYDDYCRGYTFLRYLGISYVSSGIEEFDGKEKIANVLQSNIEKYKTEASRLLKFIKNGSIKIIGEFAYEDHRQDKDRIEITHINEMLNSETINF